MKWRSGGTFSLHEWLASFFILLLFETAHSFHLKTGSAYFFAF